MLKLKPNCECCDKASEVLRKVRLAVNCQESARLRAFECLEGFATFSVYLTTDEIGRNGAIVYFECA